MIEILIAVLLSALLIGGVVQIFAGTKSTQRFQTALSRVQENGRFAIEQMSYSMRQIGFRGCAGDTQKQVTNLLSPSEGGTGGNQFNVGAAGELAGYRYAGNWQPTIAQAPSPNALITPVTPAVFRNSDVLYFNAMTSTGAKVASPYKPTATDVKFDRNVQLAQCAVVVLSTCKKTAIFVKTKNNGGGGGDSANHSKGNNCSSTNLSNGDNKITQNMAGASVLQFTAGTYYIDQPNGEAVPSLYRADGSGNATQIAQGVARMQFDYGEDTDSDQQVDQYQTDPTAVSDWTQVVGIRVHLLMVSPQDRVTDSPQTYTFPTSSATSTTATDRRLYQVFTTTVALRNRIR